jgi:hypothetical protein
LFHVHRRWYIILDFFRSLLLLLLLGAVEVLKYLLRSNINYGIKPLRLLDGFLDESIVGSL